MTIKPYKHDQFERFLFVAYPYFFSVWSTIIAAFAFVVIYLYSSWEDSKQKDEWLYVKLMDFGMVCLKIDERWDVFRNW